jgi:hypothetical protein
MMLVAYPYTKGEFRVLLLDQQQYGKSHNLLEEFV